MNFDWAILPLSVLLCGLLGSVVLSTWDCVDKVATGKDQNWFTSDNYIYIIVSISAFIAITLMYVLSC